MLEIKSIERLEEETKKIFLLEDDGIVRMVCACIIANRMDMDPVWLLIVAPSSGGKSEMIQAITGLDFVYNISDLTVNTFASGLKKLGEETSLLLKINNGVMAFKDFTSVLSKNHDAKKEIMGQLREIYDGEYTKRTGNAADIKWTGKVGAIAGATEVIYRHMEEMSAMGDRFVMYNMKQPDRMEVARRALKNVHNMKENREHLKQCFGSYIKFVLENVDDEDITLEENVKEELLNVADFAAKVRSAVLTDFKTGLVDFVPSAEMPMRITSQLYTIASAFTAMKRASDEHCDLKLNEIERKLLYKTAFDSIPRTRRDILIPLAMYKGGCSTAGVATYLNLPTKSASKYLTQINALGICTREKKGGGVQGDTWKIVEKYRDIIIRLENLTMVEDILLTSDPTRAEDELEDEWLDGEIGNADFENSGFDFG